MENIILTNNKDLRLVSVKVGVLSTLRFELPLVSASATHVEVIVTSGDVPSAYTATFIDATKRWQCDIAASQFPAVGKQSYEVAYVLDGKQFWDGKGWIEIESATTSGIEPQPRPEPYRYAVVSVNGYGADAQGAVRIPKTFIATDSPTTTEGFMEGDIYFNRETGATWTLCNVQGTLTWVFNYKNYYTKAQTDEAIERVAAYYITYTAAGAAFPTRADLINATTYYSGGVVRVPTRNDYAVVLADETHGGAEWRYIYAVADGQTTGQWEAQYPVEGVITLDNTVTRTSGNGVKSSGIWSAIWGAATTAFSSVYDWCVSQLAGKASTADATLTAAYADEWIFTATLSDADKAALYAENAAAAENDYALTISDADLYVGGYLVATLSSEELQKEIEHLRSNALRQVWDIGDVVATRTSETAHVQVYQLGSQSTKPLATAAQGVKADAALAEAEALRTSKQNALTAQQLANIAAVPNKADASAIPYSLVTQPIVNNAVTLDNRASSAVTISTTLSPNALTINFPTATSGKVRDFAMRLNIAAGVTAPEIAWPQGVTLENDGGEVPEIADGGTGGSSTILYFSETENDGTTAKFLVKGETLTAIAQA